MGLLCTCPPATEPSDIYISTCPEQVGQIQKLIFQRRLNGTALNKFTIASANPNVVASWTPLLAASDSTKVVQTPFLSEPVTTPGDPITYGSAGGNETIGGVELIIGRGPTLFEGKYLNTSNRSIADLKSWECEDTAVYLIDEHKRIWGLADDLSSVTEFYPIPIQINTLFVGDRNLGGFASVDQNMLRFYFGPNWSDKLYAVTPTDFDPLTELVTP